MPNYNKVIMIGHITRDPQLTFTTNNTPVAEFGLANNDQKDKPCFIDCRAFGKTAENIAKFFKKGRAILVEGRLEFDQWEDRSGGGKRSKHRIVADRFTFVDSQNESGGQPRQEQQAAPKQEMPFDDSSIPF